MINIMNSSIIKSAASQMHWQRSLFLQKRSLTFTLQSHVQSPLKSVRGQNSHFNGFLKTGAPLVNSVDQKRWYMRKKTLKIAPTKPLSFDYGGDLVTSDFPIDLSQPKLEFEGSKELENADETIKKLLSLEFGDGQAKQKRRIHDLVSKIKEHPLDLQSLEVIIAYQTVAVRNQMKHVLEFRKDKAAKSLLVMRIQARRKHMMRLRSLDYDKFLWLCKQLQIKYVPIPEYNRKVSKRAALKAAARNEAIAIKKEKMRLFQEKLGEEKQQFKEYKEAALSDIEKKLETLKLDNDSHLGKVFRALKYGEVDALKEKEVPLKSRRVMILERKFALAERKAKEREAQNKS